MIDPKGEEVAVPPSGVSSSKQKLLNQVLSYIGMYDNITGNEYSKEQRRLAEEAGMPFDQYIGKLIEHQLCLRSKSIKCFNDGVGDAVHEVMGKIDGFVERAPKPIKLLIQKVFAEVTPSKSRTLGGCSACGGSRIMAPRANNLGRAGTMNRLFRR
jgi:hypothetical protein